jgi:hypothetical protein
MYDRILIAYFDHAVHAYYVQLDFPDHSISPPPLFAAAVAAAAAAASLLATIFLQRPIWSGYAAAWHSTLQYRSM